MTLTWAGAADLPQVPFGRLFRRLDRPVPEGAEIVTAYTNGQVTLRSNRAKIGYHEAADLSSFRGVETGDFVVHGLDILRGSVGIADSSGAITAVCAVCEPVVDLDLRYVAHVIRVQADSGFTRALARGIREGGADFRRWGTLAELPIPMPPVEYQRAVCDHLDRETARVDTLIGEQQRLIEMLRERRASMITHVATRGLDGAPLVDSGNVFLGRVPEHWKVSRFSREVAVNGGQVDPRVDPWADMVLVAPNHIESGTGRIVGRETAREQSADSGKYLARAGQILYSKIRPALGKVAVATEDCLTSADMYAMSSMHGDHHRYLMYFMLAQPFHAFVTLASLRVKMPKVNREELGEAPFLRPPSEEQHRIVEHLDEETLKIDMLIAETQRFIELSKERRTALITAAVTGQLDLRAVA